MIRYKLKQTNYQKYVRVTVASGVSSSTTAAIAENEDTLQGVSIMEDSERVYYDGKYFSSLIRNTLAPKSVKVYVDSLAPKSAKVNRENVFCSSVTKRRRYFSA